MRKLTHYGPSLMVLVTAFLVLIAGPNAVHQLTHAYTTARVIQASERLSGDNVLEQISQAYRDIATFVEPSVVHISAQRTVIGQRTFSAALSSGSGWLYDEQGHIVTNFHVVEDANQIDAQLYNGEIRPAEIVGFDRLTDVALLKIEPGRLHPATRVDSQRRINQGELVFAFGSPFDFRFSMSTGVVSGLGRFAGVIRDQAGRRFGYENFIQVDAAINPGNSGGPLTDFRGHVIGMNTAIATGPRRSNNDEGQFSGIGLAIPIDMIEPVVTQLIRTGEVQKGFLGVSVVDRDMAITEEFRELGFHIDGVMIARLDADHESLREHFRAGDVIVALNGRQLSSPGELMNAVHELPPDTTVEFAAWRFNPQRGRGQRIDARISAALARQLGSTSLIDFKDQVAKRFEARGFIGQGVPVVMVDLDGPADIAGLRRDDIITHINDLPVTERRQVQSVVSSIPPGRTAELRIWRYDPELDTGASRTVEVELGQLDLLRLRGMLSPNHSRDHLERLGIAKMTTMTRVLAEEFGLPYNPGVLVQALVSGSDLSVQIEPGAVLVRVQDIPIDDVDGLINALSATDLSLGAKVALVNPDGSYSSAILRVE